MENHQNQASLCPTPKGFTSHGLFGKPGFTFNEAFNYPADNWNVILWIATSLLILITAISCFTLITKHVRNYNLPIIQQHKLRILIYPPFYALLTWISYIEIDYITIISLFATLFEAFAVYNLYTCLYDYLKPLREQMKDTKIPSHVKVLRRFNLKLQSKWGMHFRVIISILIIQYPIWTILNAIITVIVQSQGYYCESASIGQGAHFYLMIIELISLITVVVSLLTYIRVFEDEFKLADIPYMGMFWTIKLPIFIITFVGSIVLPILESRRVIKPIFSDDGMILWSPIQITAAIKTTVCCFAMFLSSIMMIKYIAFDKYNNSGTVILELNDDNEQVKMIMNKNEENQPDIIYLKKRSPGYAIVDGYFYYIPRFFYQIYLSLVDVYHLLGKRKELKKRRNLRYNNNSGTTTTSEESIPSYSSSFETSHHNENIYPLNNIHPVSTINPSYSQRQ